MMNLLIPSLNTLGILYVARFLYSSARKPPSKHTATEAPDDHPAPPPEVLELVAKYGSNSNSFMTLYPGFHYFFSLDPTKPGVIAYVKLSQSWIAGTEPFTAPENYSSLLNQFAAEAEKNGKTATFIPVGLSGAKKAIDQGYSAILIGSEPIFHLDHYPKTGNTWIDTVPSAKNLDLKGAEVIHLDLKHCTAEIKEELNQVTHEWRESRKMAPLGFLNQVDPWFLSEHKRYFYLESSGRIQAFLAAIPIWSTKGWYLIDLVRKSDSPAGATELLTLQAMKKLRDGGAEIISLGVSPLSQLEKAQSIPFIQENKKIYFFLNFLYRKGRHFYNFKPLFEFKQKFCPTENIPIFMIYKNRNNKLNFIKVVNVFQAFLGNGVGISILIGIRRSLQLLNLSRLITSQLKTSVVVRSRPASVKEILFRLKFTISIFSTNLVIYFITTDSYGRIFPHIEKEWAYSFGAFLADPIHSLLLSPFLHWNLIHINFNILTLAIFSGGLEYYIGSRVTAICYLVPMILSNPVTSLIFNFFGHTNLFNIDIGASLGVFGCIGAFGFLIRYTAVFLGPLLATIAIQSIGTHDWVNMDHFTAIIFGLILGKLLI